MWKVWGQTDMVYSYSQALSQIMILKLLTIIEVCQVFEESIWLTQFPSINKQQSWNWNLHQCRLLQQHF